MPRHWIFRSLAAIVIVLSLAGGGRAAVVKDANTLKLYETRYYLMRTDLPADQAREAAIRMTRMAEEYHERTKAFSGVINRKLPFYLFREEADYIAAGGLPGSAGVFTGDSLMAIAGDSPSRQTWHIIQHEGFHQFVHAVIGGDMPIWMNEGLAEYFGYALFTGDSFISGVIPPEQAQAIKTHMKLPHDAGGFRPVNEIMLLSHLQWNQEMSHVNYDQAWSMVQFLAHGDDGKYQKPFASMMIELGRNRPWDVAWRDNFGSVSGFEDRWRAFYQGLGTDPTDTLYAKATVSTLSSFLARCSRQKQTFANFAAFTDAAQTGKLKITDADWLPDSLIQNALEDVNRRAKAGAKFSILGTSLPAGAVAINPKPGQVTCTLRDGTQLVGAATYTADGHVDKVTVTVTDPRAKSEAGK